jgi:hypothetical protein
MRSLLVIVSILMCAVIVLVVPQVAEPIDIYRIPMILGVYDYGKAVVLLILLSLAAGYLTFRQPVDGPFLLKLFVAAVLVRVLVGTMIYTFNGQEFFGGDAMTYDFWGWMQLKAFGGDFYSKTKINEYFGPSLGTGWGMLWMVAGIYGLIGRNMLAVQLVNSVFGAATVTVIYLCAHHLFQNSKVARIAALAVAFFPSLVLWSCQGLKDGPIVFFLALAILATLKLGDKFNGKYLAILLFSLMAILSLRFYIFYMLIVAVAGTFIIGTRQFTSTGFAKQIAIMIVLGLALTWFGINRFATLQYERFGSLEQVQASRADAVNRAGSSYGGDFDVSTPQGALLTIPIGLVYLIFAPFPWQLTSLRQSITLPEMIVWWACFPLLVLGLWFSIKYRLRQIFPVLTFTIMLSLAYSIFQGNVGTAYRQRAQLLVFYFIFVAVGYVLMLEKREEKQRKEAEAKAALARRPTSRTASQT